MMILKQKTPSGVIEYELEDEALVLKQKQGAERLQTRIKYATLLTDPDHRASSERKFLYFAIFLGFLMLFFGGIGASTKDEVSRIFFIMLAFVTFIVAAVFFYRFRKSRFDVLTYFYRNGAFAFNLWRNLPDEVAFSDFLPKLTTLIKEGQETSVNAGASASLSSEIDRLGALRVKGFLTDDEFARAKASLLEQLERGGRVMGFHQ